MAEGPVSYKLAYLPPALSGTLKLIQDCGIPSLRFCNEYLYKFNPPLILDFENGSGNGLKFTGNIILKSQMYYESHSSDLLISSASKSASYSYYSL